MWLLRIGKQPERSYNDGTTEIQHYEKYLDTIGIRGFTPDELVKLLVVLIYEGIPRDIVIFGNDRITSPVVQLSCVGITNPLIVIMSGSVWRDYNRKKIALTKDPSGKLLVDPLEDLDMVYDLDAYAQIKEFHLGMAITHHDDVESIVQQRQDPKVGIRPFQHVVDLLGGQVKASMKMENTLLEMIFRFIYIFEKKYGKKKLECSEWCKSKRLRRVGLIDLFHLHPACKPQ